MACQTKQVRFVDTVYMFDRKRQPAVRPRGQAAASSASGRGWSGTAAGVLPAQVIQRIQIEHAPFDAQETAKGPDRPPNAAWWDLGPFMDRPLSVERAGPQGRRVASTGLVL